MRRLPYDGGVAADLIKRTPALLSRKSRWVARPSEYLRACHPPYRSFSTEQVGPFSSVRSAQRAV